MLPRRYIVRLVIFRRLIRPRTARCSRECLPLGQGGDIQAIQTRIGASHTLSSAAQGGALPTTGLGPRAPLDCANGEPDVNVPWRWASRFAVPARSPWRVAMIRHGTGICDAAAASNHSQARRRTNS